MAGDADQLIGLFEVVDVRVRERDVESPHHIFEAFDTARADDGCVNLVLVERPREGRLRYLGALPVGKLLDALIHLVTAAFKVRAVLDVFVGPTVGYCLELLARVGEVTADE